MHGYTQKAKAFHLAFSMFQWWLMNKSYDVGVFFSKNVLETIEAEHLETNTNPKMLPSRELTYPPKKWHFDDDFPNFPRWDMLIPWMVSYSKGVVWLFSKDGRQAEDRNSDSHGGTGVCVFMAVFHYNPLLVFENKISSFFADMTRFPS